MIIHQNKKFVKHIDKFEFLLYNYTIKAASAAVRRYVNGCSTFFGYFLRKPPSVGAEGGFCTYFRLWLL